MPPSVSTSSAQSTVLTLTVVVRRGTSVGSPVSMTPSYRLTLQSVVSFVSLILHPSCHASVGASCRSMNQISGQTSAPVSTLTREADITKVTLR